LNCKKPTFELVITSKEPQKIYRPLSGIQSWDDYFDNAFPSLGDGVRQASRNLSTSHPDPIRPLRMLAFECLSSTLTILSALEDVIPDLPNRASLCIHVNGADQTDCFRQEATEEILHLLPKLMSLSICYVGEDLEPDVSQGRANLACPSCSSYSEHTKRISFHRGTYQSFLTTPTARRTKPDLICCLNGAFARMIESEPMDFALLLTSRIPLLITTSTKAERKIEDDALRTKRVQMLPKSERRNCWSGVSPITASYQLEYDHCKEEPALFSNKWRYIIRGASEKPPVRWEELITTMTSYVRHQGRH
jgi:hypothetical protein